MLSVRSLVMNSNLKLTLKRNVYNQRILQVLPYGSETWRVTKELEKKLRSAQRGMERGMMGITWRNRKRASWIREKTKVEDILMTMKRKKWTWALHVIRRRDNMDYECNRVPTRDGTRNLGRQRARWSK